MKRVFLIVADSFGIGALPDAALFNDRGANTLKGIASSSYFRADNMIKLGLANIEVVNCLEKTDAPIGKYGALKELSMGKDTTIGHFEISGQISRNPLPTYKDGFPEEIINTFIEKTGCRGVLCNKPYSGTEVIRDYGEEHERTGYPIVYTSADSVFQIAAREDIIPLEKLYEYCSIARSFLKVGRVIARPFIKTENGPKRTANRRDYSIEPPYPTMLDVLKEKGKDVIAVGKIRDIFAGRGITEHIPTHSNKEGMDTAEKLLERDFNGLAFINLVDFDMVYGHRNDVDGYAAAIAEFDLWLGGFIPKMKDEDLLIVTADHGCDPSDISTDHTREYVPFLMYHKGIEPADLGIIEGFTFNADMVFDWIGLKEV